MTDIDTQIEERIKTFMDDNLHVVLEDEGDQSVIPTEQFAQDLAKAIKTLLIQSKIEELEAIMDFDDEPVHLNFDEEINPITVGERIDQLKEEL